MLVCPFWMEFAFLLVVMLLSSTLSPFPMISGPTLSTARTDYTGSPLSSNGKVSVCHHPLSICCIWHRNSVSVGWPRIKEKKKKTIRIDCHHYFTLSLYQTGLSIPVGLQIEKKKQHWHADDRGIQ